MSPLPRRSLRWLVWIACFSLLLGCSKSDGGKQSSEGPAQVKLALNWLPDPEFGGFYAGREDGLFKKNGIEVEILGGGAGTPVVQMVATGQVEFGITGADDIIVARARGADIIPILAVFQKSPQAIMAHASRGAKGISDVLGSGTLAVELGLPYVAFLKKKYGFDKVKIVPYDGGVARFVNDKDFAQQCFITSEPLAARQKGADPSVFLIADEGFNPYLVVVIAKKSLWTEKPELVRAFRRASIEGWRAYLADPAKGNAVIAKLNAAMDAETLGRMAAVQKPLIETEETAKNGLGTMTRERWEVLGKQLVELGIITKAPPPDEYLMALE